MSQNRKKALLAAAVIVLLIVIDQTIKVAVKTNMMLGEQIVIFDWFRIDFIENNGMAWGMELGSKMLLSLFRIVAVVVLLWYLARCIKRGLSTGYLVVIAMIIAGAAGNIFDSLFYGEIFTESTPWSVSQLVGWGDGYAPMLMGKVVDMFYLPIIHGTLPEWMPLWGGEEFTFFSPVFNFADSCITVGVIVLLVAYHRQLNADLSSKKTKEEEK